MKDISKGYIALYRQFIDWEWYDDANTMRLFIHCLLLANYKDKKWRGKIIKHGSFITSQPKLAHSLKLSIMQIRNSLKKLKSTGEITVLSTADYSVITVKNYDLYQKNNSLTNRQTSQNEQSSNRLITTTNKDNNSNTCYINSSSSSSITEEEEEILKKYSKEKNKIKYFGPWLRKITKNGDLKEVLEKAKRWKQRQEDAKKAQDQVINPEVEECTEEERIAAMKKAHEIVEKVRRKK